jgi:N,N'-diacetyllegionaminate synthase
MYNTQKKTIIIAEAGVNHNGDLSIAKNLIEEAASAGADYVKFQSFKASSLVSKNAKKAEYQVRNTNNNESQFDMLKKLELNDEMHYELIKHSKKNDIKFLSTPFDIDSIKYLVDLGLNVLKVPSGEITNLPYLRYIGSTKKKIIISTGMSTLEEVKSALKILIDAGSKKNELTFLHCNTEYPTPFEDVNLNAMLTLKKKLNVKVGYSDHSKGIAVPIAATTLGAEVIEKHFTLDRTMDGPDHKASLVPSELSEMVKSIRQIELSLGDGIKKPSKSEIKNMEIARKSIVAKKNIRQGEEF